MLGGDHHRVEADHPAPLVLHRHLGFPVGPEPGQLAVLPDLGELAGQGVGVVDGRRHQLRRLPAGIAEHQALVPGPARVHAHGDVGALPVNGHHHRAGGVVETLVVVVVADVAHHVPRQLGHRDVGVRRDLARHQHQPRGQQGLAGHAAAGVILQGRIQNRIGNLVGHLVRMAFRDAFRGEEALVHVHARSSKEGGWVRGGRRGSCRRTGACVPGCRRG
ncbi:hypothetical protein GALL_464220 [mine drainage metagenome]|uniref:Uncharacterized protein n=1 Tax=mine drainage metagenome TaxID=410659 RepID=A0A1J5PWM3_9ZZZZ